MKVSIILPYYKHKPYLIETVMGIMEQDHEDWELLLMNDDPDEDLTPYEMLDRRIHVYTCEENRGQAYRLNQGIDLATGDYIAFQDADDIPFHFRLSLSLEYIGAGAGDILYADAIMFLQNGEQRYLKAPDKVDLEMLSYRSVGVFDSTLVRTELAKRVKFDDIGYGNDRVWWIKIMQQQPRVVYLPLPVYYYRHNTSNFRINPKSKFETLLARIHRKHLNRKLQKYVNAML